MNQVDKPQGDPVPEKTRGGSKSRHNSIFSVNDTRRDDLNAVFENPLARVPDEVLMQNVEEFCQKFDMMEHIEDVKKGALVAKTPTEIENATFLNEQERESILREKTHKWDHPWMLYWLCGMALVCVFKTQC